MKIRTGFVSNSSSSSFMAVFTEADYIAAIRVLDVEVTELLTEVFKNTFAEMIGKESIYIVKGKQTDGFESLGSYHSDCYYGEEEYKESRDERDRITDAFVQLTQKIREIGGKVIYHYGDF